MNILFLADPNSIHDIKWISFFTEKYNCFLVMRPYSAEVMGKENFSAFEEKHHVKILGVIEDFSLRHFFRTIKQFQFLNTEIRSHKIDLLHIMYAEPNALWAYFRNSLNIPIVLTTRGTDVLKTIPFFFNNPGILNKLVAACYKKALLKCDVITCTSYQQKESVLKLTAKKAQKVEVIRTGVDIDKILGDTTVFKLSELEGGKYVFFPRAMRPLYQHEFAISAIKLLPEEIRNKFSFVFIDKNSADNNYVSLIRNEMNDCEANFIWLNNLEQSVLFQTYKNASLVVMTPASDGSPVSAIETMLCKVPLILPPLPYDKDLFSEGVVFFESWKAEDLALQIESLLEGDQKLNTESSFQNAINLADRKREMTKLGKIYSEIAPKKS